MNANLLAMKAPKTHGESINIACGIATSINKLFALLCEICGRDTAAIHAVARLGDVKHSLADTAAAKKLLGYYPVMDFNDGIQYTVDWYKRSVQQ